MATDLQVFVFDVEFFDFNFLHLWLLVGVITVTVDIHVNIEILQGNTMVTITFMIPNLPHLAKLFHLEMIYA